MTFPFACSSFVKLMFTTPWVLSNQRLPAVGSESIVCCKSSTTAIAALDPGSDGHGANAAHIAMVALGASDAEEAVMGEELAHELESDSDTNPKTSVTTLPALGRERMGEQFGSDFIAVIWTVGRVQKFPGPV